jgi:hypothetical protein
MPDAISWLINPHLLDDTGAGDDVVSTAGMMPAVNCQPCTYGPAPTQDGLCSSDHDMHVKHLRSIGLLVSEKPMADTGGIHCP